jgi:DNA polymerase-3 subunit delta'
MALHVGASPRFFAQRDLSAATNLAALSEWSKALSRTMRTMDHPFNAGLMLEALVGQAKSVLNSGTP